MHPHVYQCPGESHPISRSVHLARLANAYTPCATCLHRSDDGTNSPRRRKQLAELLQRQSAASLFDDEGISADYYNCFTASHAQRLGRAFGIYLSRQDPSEPRRVVIGSDGGSLAPEVVAALSRGLRWSGIQATESGWTTAPELVWQQHLLQASGAVYIAQAHAARHRMQVRFWQTGGHPLSSTGSLEQLVRHFDSHDRPARQSAGRERAAPPTQYLDALRSHFHALRPLNLVLKCACRPLSAQLDELLKQVGCGIILAGQSDDVSRRVPPARAHFGAELTHFGEGLTICDEHGQSLPPAELMSLIASVCEPGRRSAGHASRKTHDWSREQAYLHLAQAAETIIIGADHRCWFRLGDQTFADGLRALALLLVALSQSDHPLSQRVHSSGPVQISQRDA